MQRFSIKDCLTLPQQKQGFSRRRSISQRKSLDKEMSLRQYSICVDEVEKKTEEIAEIIFAHKKSPYRTGLNLRVGLERRPFPAMPKAGDSWKPRLCPAEPTCRREQPLADSRNLRSPEHHHPCPQLWLYYSISGRCVGRKKRKTEEKFCSFFTHLSIIFLLSKERCVSYFSILHYDL